MIIYLLRAAHLRSKKRKKTQIYALNYYALAVSRNARSVAWLMNRTRWHGRFLKFSGFRKRKNIATLVFTLFYT